MCNQKALQRKIEQSHASKYPTFPRTKQQLAFRIAGNQSCFALVCPRPGQIPDDPSLQTLQCCSGHTMSAALLSHIGVSLAVALVVSRRTQKYSQIFLKSRPLYFFFIAALIEFINLSPGGQGAYFHFQTCAIFINKERGFMADKCLT